MRRKLLGLFASAALVLGWAPAVGAAGSDEHGPPCADIIAGDGFNTGTTVEVLLRLEGPSCRAVTYTTYVLDEEGDTTPLAVASVEGTGSTLVHFVIPITDDDDAVYVYSTTSIGRHVFDRAGDTGSLRLTVGSGPPGQDYS